MAKKSVKAWRIRSAIDLGRKFLPARSIVTEGDLPEDLFNMLRDTDRLIPVDAGTGEPILPDPPAEAVPVTADAEHAPAEVAP